MEKIRYQVLDRQGKTSVIELAACDAATAKRQIRRMGCTPLRQYSAADSFSAGSFFRRKKRFDLYRFTCRLAPLLGANIPLEKALAIIEDGVKNADEREILLFLRQGLHEGKSFSALAVERNDIFTPLYSSLLESGEHSGNLPVVVNELRRFLKESKEFKDFVVTSSIYPAIVVSVTLGVVFLLFTVFIPRFVKIFQELGRKLPMLTGIMLDIGTFMQSTWLLWLVLGCGLFFFIRYGRRYYPVKLFSDRIILKLPLAGKLIQSIQMSRFIRTLSIMVSSNVHILDGIRISIKVVDNSTIAASLSPIGEKLRAGFALSEILGNNKFMPDGSRAMLKIAEESGETGEMLERIADESEEATRLLVKRLLTMLEPAVILFLAAIVLTVVLAIFLAIMEMNVIK